MAVGLLLDAKSLCYARVRTARAYIRLSRSDNPLFGI